jgi:hypothetical protein
MEKRTINKQTILIVPQGGNLNKVATSYMQPLNEPIKAKKHLGEDKFLLLGDLDITVNITNYSYELY